MVKTEIVQLLLHTHLVDQHVAEHDRVQVLHLARPYLLQDFTNVFQDARLESVRLEVWDPQGEQQPLLKETLAEQCEVGVLLVTLEDELDRLAVVSSVRYKVARIRLHMVLLKEPICDQVWEQVGTLLHDIAEEAFFSLHNF